MELFKEEYFRKKTHCIIFNKYIIKLKDNSSYEFNTKEKKNKFIKFIKDYNIISNNNIKNIDEGYKFLGYTNKLKYYRFFYNILIFNGYNKYNKLIKFITFQPYTAYIFGNNDEKLINYISKQKILMLVCAYYGHTINIFKNNKYNWCDPYTTFILLTLNHNLKKSNYTEINIHYNDKIKTYKINVDYSLFNKYSKYFNINT